MRIYTIFLFLCLATYLNGEEFIKDENFSNGFLLLGNNDSNPSVKEIMKVEEERIGDTVWRLAEWNSNSSLVGDWNGHTGKDLSDWVSDSSSTGWRWSNPSKSVTVGFGRGSGDVTLAINADNDLNHIPSAYPDTGDLPNGEYKNWWPHLLIEQQFLNNPIPIISTLVWNFNAKLIHWERDRGGAWQSNPGEFVTYLLVRDRVTAKTLWLGMTIFNTSSNENSIYISDDVHTNIPIYKIGVNRARREFTNYSNNVYQMLSKAINAYKAKNLPLDISLDHAEIVAINLGWEVRGLDIGTMTISDLSLSTSTSGVSNITNSSAMLFWDNRGSNVIGYNIYSGGSFIATVGPNLNSFVIDGLLSNTNYTYEVRAESDNGQTTIANINFQTDNVIETLNAPSSLDIENVSSSGGRLLWNDNSDNETGFKIYQNNTLVATVGANTTSYIIDNLFSNTEYVYKVKSYNSNNESNEISLVFRTLDVIPSKPTNLKITEITTNSALLEWDDTSNNEQGFKIYKNGEWLATVGQNITSYRLLGLKTREEYTLQVLSYNDIGKSDRPSIFFVAADDFSWLIPIYYIINF